MGGPRSERGSRSRKHAAAAPAPSPAAPSAAPLVVAPLDADADAGVSWADVKLFFFTWAALVALFGLGGYLLYEDEYQRQLQEHLMNKGAQSTKEGRYDDAIASYTAILEKERDHPQALTNRGIAFTNVGQDTKVWLVSFLAHTSRHTAASLTRQP